MRIGADEIKGISHSDDAPVQAKRSMTVLSLSSSSNLRRKVSLALVLGLAVGASACTRTGPFSGGNLSQVQQQPAPLTPAPLPVVQQQTLPPPPVQTGPVVATAPTGDLQPSLDGTTDGQPPVQVASVTAADAAQPVTTGALVGAWTVAVGGGGCQIFMSTTKWSGGNRAAVKGCGGTDIGDVQAWRLAGKQVVLVDKSGSQAATLYRSSDERFDGSTSKGKAISFSR